MHNTPSDNILISKAVASETEEQNAYEYTQRNAPSKNKSYGCPS